MRVGIVCPYSFDAPGGVQSHARDLAEALIADGHEVSVLAPAGDGTAVPDYVVAAGRAIPIHYNGSVARLTFGPVTAARVRKWLQNGKFDVLHLHEPAVPSLSMLALWIADGPIVATFHTSMVRSRPLQIAYPFVRQSLEKISARIAVSEDARRTLIEHLGGDAVVIPNGVYVARFGEAEPDPRWQGTLEHPTVAFLGRLDEPRKGLGVLLAAVAQVRRSIPGARFLIAGIGETGPDQVEQAGVEDAVELLGAVSEQEKAALFSSADVYCAPQTGGESFGIVLVEAMSAGAAVVASDLGAFRRVLGEGTAGALFRTGDSDHLAETLIDLLGDPRRRKDLNEAATERLRRYDWSAVLEQIHAVYEMAVEGHDAPVGEDPTSVRDSLMRLARGDKR